MPTPSKRIAPWLTLSVARGSALQAGGLIGALASRLVRARLKWLVSRDRNGNTYRGGPCSRGRAKETPSFSAGAWAKIL